MAHMHQVFDDDFVFSIDSASRVIHYMSDDNPIITQGDHNSERFTFELPRYVDGHDMTLCNKVEVHYLNVSSDSKPKRKPGVYKITDLQVDPDDENVVICSWLISQNATEYVGSLNFVLRFACTSGSKIDYSWNTSPYSGVVVVESIDNAELIVEQHADILEQWYMEFVMAAVTGVNMVDEACEEAIKRIKSIDVIVEVENETIDRIKTAQMEAIEEIRKTESETIDSEKEELIVEILNRLPVYGGEVEVVT